MWYLVGGQKCGNGVRLSRAIFPQQQVSAFKQCIKPCCVDYLQAVQLYTTNDHVLYASSSNSKHLKDITGSIWSAWVCTITSSFWSEIDVFFCLVFKSNSILAENSIDKLLILPCRLTRFMICRHSDSSVWSDSCGEKPKRCQEGEPVLQCLFTARFTCWMSLNSYANLLTCIYDRTL